MQRSSDTGGLSLRRPTAGLAAGSFLAFAHLGLTMAALGPAMPFLAAATSSSLAAVSSVFIAQNLGYMLGSFFGGRLYDRLPGTRLLSITVWAMIPALVLIPLARSLALLLAAVFLLGIEQGIVDVGGNVLILWTPPQGRSTRMNALHLFWGVGATLCLLIMAQAVRLSGGIAWQYWSMAVLAVPVALILLRLPPMRGQHVPGAASGASGTSSTSGTSSAFGRAWLLGVVLVALLILFVVAAEVGYCHWIYTYALTLGLADKVSAAYLTSAFWAAFTTGRLAATLLSARLKPLSVLLGSLVGCLAATAAVLLWPGPALWAGTAAFGFFIAPLFAAIFNLAGEAMTLTGSITGIFLVGTSIGGLALPWLIGQLFEPLGPASMPAALLAALAAALLCCLLIALASSRRRQATAARSR